MIKVNKKLILVLTIILIPVILFLSNGIITFNTQVSNYPELDNFFKLDQDLPDDYTEQEIIHLYEIKELLNNLNSILTMGVILLILCLVSLFLRNKQNIPTALYYGGLITIVLCILIILLSLTNFDLFFRGFHNVLFDTNNWLLPSETKLIQNFPTSFWIKAIKNLFLFLLIEGIIISQIGRIVKKRQHWVERNE